MVAGFLSSIRIERLTARSYLNIAKAQIAAESGLQMALQNFSPTSGSLTNYNYISGVFPNTNGFSKRSAPFIIFRDNIGLLTSTNYLYSAITTNSVASIQLVSGEVEVEAGYVNIKNSSGTTSTRFAYWTDEGNSKLNVKVSGGNSNTRNKLADLSELPILDRSNNLLKASDVNSIQAKQDFLLTPRSINQIVAFSPTADDYDFTTSSRSISATPEGNPKLNLQRLKEHVETLPTTQGPVSPRVKLIEQLLNLDGAFPPTSENPWGYGNFEVFLSRYNQTEAKQIVANILDYIDSDIIPTTDGEAGAAPKKRNSTSSKRHFQQNEFEKLNTTIAPPSFIGIEARLKNNLVQGHPFLTFYGFGFHINFNSSDFNSAHIYNCWGLANPYESPTERFSSSGSASGGAVKYNPKSYAPESQSRARGDVSSSTKHYGGSRGTPNLPTGTDAAWNYFPLGYMAREQLFVDGKYGGNIAGYETITTPRKNSGSFANDYAIGYLDRYYDDMRIDNFGFSIDAAKLIYTGTDQVRYLIQDIGILKDEVVPYPGGTLSSNAYSYANPRFICSLAQKNRPPLNNWHYLGDPRLSFKRNGWVIDESSDPQTNPQPIP